MVIYSPAWAYTDTHMREQRYTHTFTDRGYSGDLHSVGEMADREHITVLISLKEVKYELSF